MKSSDHCYLACNGDGRMGVGGEEGGGRTGGGKGVGRENGRKTRWIFRNGPPEKQSQSNLRWMRLISPNNNRREAFVLLSRLAQTMAIHANPWPEPAILPM